MAVAAVDGQAVGNEADVLIDPVAESGPPLTELPGRFTVSNGLVLTAISL